MLDERVVGADAPPEVWVAGYSMGGSVAQLAALAAQEHLDARMGAEVRAGSSAGGWRDGHAG